MIDADNYGICSVHWSELLFQFIIYNSNLHVRTPEID